jgi:uncharacterized protein YndB with AHSA1/START domain
MVRQSPNSRPVTAERTANIPPALLTVAREVTHGRTVVILSRDLDGTPQDVWALLTRPDRLRMWAPHTADRDLSTVGKVTFTMLGDDLSTEGDLPNLPDLRAAGVVLVADRPRLLEHSWATDLLAWHLPPLASGCRLTLHHTLADDSMASAVAAGWHVCLDVAASILDGHPTPPLRGAEAFKHGWSDLNERYAEALGVEPTVIPQPRTV